MHSFKLNTRERVYFALHAFSLNPLNNPLIYEAILLNS